MEVLIEVPALGRGLPGTLTIPASARAVVAFAHGSGSSRLSPRNAFVAGTLQGRGIATLLLDLLTPQEDRDPEARFDIALLTRRHPSLRGAGHAGAGRRACRRLVRPMAARGGRMNECFR